MKLIQFVIMVLVTLILLFLASMFVFLLVKSPGKLTVCNGIDGKPVKWGISEKIFLEINGTKQGMFIRGKNTGMPVLLFLHGGPGMPTYFLSEKYPNGLEENFIVCYWEQRGGGISYNPSLKETDINTGQLVGDAIEVSDYLCKRFNKEKIYLLGHSWGTFIGIQAAQKSPDLFYAYIGVAQISDQRESEKQTYSFMMEEYSKSGDVKMAEKLSAYPVLKDDGVMISYFKSGLRDNAMHKLGVGTMRNMKSVVTGVFFPVMKCRAYTLREKINIWRAKAFLKNKTKLIDELFSNNLIIKVPRLNVPVYFISGSFDRTVSYSLSKAYFYKIESPRKGFYTFLNSAHSPLFEEPIKFNEIITNDILKGGTSLSDKE